MNTICKYWSLFHTQVLAALGRGVDDGRRDTIRHNDPLLIATGWLSLPVILAALSYGLAWLFCRVRRKVR